mmetsp:Transcript_14649/g.21648  ORF Transcript_14649/g.21648 Transcript_14649/m.21648 type:complete len:886 (+) Transcript_14649:72-2729(+)|eukprot:CAMPEP_0195525388 /NCGR_PEP_ID=MMETSP0794_2-20130614/25830_1 /TAXON_ID=515487 /ORGANISM="Stephanopyxis turris, Strain CCMP 815" /LENGTH=885 /DNA_ID=CAMNT_0040655845 /DNA_START=69 /DNA_END=2726 /DNA_ORIENTATION=+
MTSDTETSPLTHKEDVSMNNDNSNTVTFDTNDGMGYGSFMEQDDHQTADLSTSDIPETTQLEINVDMVTINEDQEIGQEVHHEKKRRLRERTLNSWIRRQSSALSLDEDASRFMGQKNKSLAKLVDSRRKNVLSDSNFYKSSNREIVDTPVWNRRKQALMEKNMSEMKTTKKGRSSKSSLDHTKIVKHLSQPQRLFTRLLIVGIGAVMAVAGFMISKSAEKILETKIGYAIQAYEMGRSGLLVHVCLSGLLGFMAFLPVAARPVSAGSGIAEAKAVLNGVIIPECASLGTALCKGISVIMSVAASLPAGLEGPMIHLGLCIGNNANRLLPQSERSLDVLRTDRSRIDFAAIGTAAGVAVAFRSPISGVLFAMEEGSSFWTTKLTWNCFVSACICVITVYFMIACETGFKNFDIQSMAIFDGIEEAMFNAGKQHVSDSPSFHLWEYLPFAVFGALGGFVGACFCELNRTLAIWRRSMNFGLTVKAVEVVGLTVIMAALTWQLPLIFSVCKSLDDVHTSRDHFRQFNCPTGEYNELATLLLNPLGAVGINLLFHEGIDAFSVTSLVVAGLVNLLMLVVVFGASISAGIFIPLLYAGACFGRAAAIELSLDPRTYAIIGAAAMLGGVVRVLISLTAIIVHATSLSYFLTPVMIVTIMAQYFGNNTFSRPGIYDIILALRGIPFLEEEPPIGAKFETIRARHIMIPVVSLSSDIEVGELVSLLRSYPNSSFVVVDNQQNDSLVGMISRSDLKVILCHKKIFHTYNIFDESPPPLNEKFLSYDELVKDQPFLPNLDDIEDTLSKEDKLKFVNLTPYVQIAPHTFDGHGSAERAYEMFRTLGLHSLLVLDQMSRPIGRITRHELVLLEEIDLDDEIFLNKQRDVGNFSVIS